MLLESQVVLKENIREAPSPASAEHYEEISIPIASYEHSEQVKMVNENDWFFA